MKPEVTLVLALKSGMFLAIWIQFNVRRAGLYRAVSVFQLLH
jgi:hypothetical protein